MVRAQYKDPSTVLAAIKAIHYLVNGDWNVRQKENGTPAFLVVLKVYLAILSAPILSVLNYLNRVYLFFTTVSRPPDLAWNYKYIKYKFSLSCTRVLGREMIFIFRCSHLLPVFQFFFLYVFFPLIECPFLATGIDNGYKHGRGSVEGSSVWFSSLEGNKYLYGDEDGQWNDTIRSCLKR